ncbi:uncharacterized protein LOC144318215 [Canis aureus]
MNQAPNSQPGVSASPAGGNTGDRHSTGEEETSKRIHKHSPHGVLKSCSHFCLPGIHRESHAVHPSLSWWAGDLRDRRGLGATVKPKTASPGSSLGRSLEPRGARCECAALLFFSEQKNYKLPGDRTRLPFGMQSLTSSSQGPHFLCSCSREGGVDHSSSLLQPGMSIPLSAQNLACANIGPQERPRVSRKSVRTQLEAREQEDHHWGPYRAACWGQSWRSRMREWKAASTLPLRETEESHTAARTVELNPATREGEGDIPATSLQIRTRQTKSCRGGKTCSSNL